MIHRLFLQPHSFKNTKELFLLRLTKSNLGDLLVQMGITLMGMGFSTGLAWLQLQGDLLLKCNYLLLVLEKRILENQEDRKEPMICSR